MGFASYSELQTEIANFLDRTDLTSQIPSFISLAEASINRDVRHWQMEKRVEATFNQRYEPLPTDWIESRRISIKGQKQLDLLSQAQMMNFRDLNNNTSGEPRYYTISTSQLEFYPTPDGDYAGSMIYLARVDALTDSNVSNWLLSDSPDVYLYGSLMHSAPYLQEDPRLAVWAGLYSDAVRKLNERSMEGQYSGSGLTIR